MTEYNKWWVVGTQGVSRRVFEEEDRELNENDEESFNSNDLPEHFLERCGAWNLFRYYSLNRVVIFGRDIFGRRSLVCRRLEDGRIIIGCRCHPDISGDWVEVPFGNVTCLDIGEMKAIVYSYFEDYPEDIFGNYLSVLDGWSVQMNIVSKKQELVQLSREISDSLPDAELFLEKGVKACKRLLMDLTEGSICIGFSGGVDSLFVAHAVHMAVADGVQIDLVNVAFGNDDKCCEKAPDRIRARQSFDCLRRSYENRKFRLIVVNVDEVELKDCRRQFVSNAIKPASTVLDDSIACVLWFALRAEGIDDNGEKAKSLATRFVVGSGADELLAGYSRHRHRYEKDGSNVVVAEECEKELRRLGARNGGRDARIAAQQGKTLIAPLLDDEFVEFVNQLAPNHKWDMALGRGMGEKRILREALRALGSPHDFPKQAMQFGSRIAKMTNQGNSATKGSDSSPFL